MKAISLSLLAAGAACAGDAITLNTKPAPVDWVDAVKQALVVYENEDTFVRKVRLASSIQWQMASVQPNGSNGLHLKDGATPYNHEFRRVYLGLNVDFASGTQFHTWVRPGGLPSRFTFPGGRTKRNFTYFNFYDIWVKQDIHAVKGLSVKLGKICPLITTEYSTGSSTLKCIERSVVGNQFGLDSNWGVDVTYAPSKNDKVYFQLMANDRAPSGKNTGHSDLYGDGKGFKGEFGWEDKCFAIIGAEHKFGITDDGYHKISAQYGHDFDNSYDNGLKRGANYYGLNVKDAISVGYDYVSGKFHLQTNVVSAFEMAGAPGSKNIGLQVQPMYSITPNVDLVFRYAGMTGEGSCKLGADRYICTNTTAASWVDSINSFYFGVNLYANSRVKDAAKIMFGAEYITARKNGKDCYNGWEFITAMRSAF